MKSFNEFLVEHDSATLMGIYGQMAWDYLSKKMGMRAGGYMQRMFGDPKFVDMLNPVIQKAFGVPNFSDLQTVIDKYMESNPS